ncbi:unnamed protein product [Rhodiola kirilowii]
MVASGDDDVLPREALMKVCLKKPGVSSILQFNCGITGKVDGSEMYLNGVFLLSSAAAVGSFYDAETLWCQEKAMNQYSCCSSSAEHNLVPCLPIHP